ncbi:lantibiotic dehydratase [Fibrella sp. WM1]|uniref:lantibiotic dehydratase n=1 Tax=Fibrella musci TaxID=3242485 RepID=UPI003522F02C
MQVSDFFMVRRPTYPLQALAQFYKLLTTNTIDEVLRTYYRDPVAQEAIFVASPGLYERLQCWLAGEPLPEQKKLINTLHKYLVRMCSRATPYGLFAGCSLGTFADASRLRADLPDVLRAHVRVDTDCLRAIGQWLTQQPQVRAQLLLFPNSSLYRVGASWRYVEQQRGADQRLQYFISAVEAEAALNCLLTAAQSGATIHQLAHQLTADTPTDVLDEAFAEAVDFVEQLIESQLLVFEVEPAVTGIDALKQLATRIGNLPDAADVAQSLWALHNTLRLPDRLLAYDRTRQWFAERQIDAPTTDVVQVNAFFPNTITIGQSVIRLLQRDLDKLLVLNQPAHRPDLDEFARRFTNRYEEEEIPLSLALDNEFGVGYGNVSTLGVGYAPLIDDLSVGITTALPTATWDWWHTLVMEKYTEALRTRQAEIELTDEDLAYIGRQQRPATPLPGSFYAFGSLLGSSEKALDAGDFQFNLLGCGGPSAMNLLSRFGEGEPALAAHIRACAAAEEARHPDVVIAEVIHLPENRVGNILARPPIHQYEIPYLGQASVAAEYQIPITDLLLSTRDGRVVLRSKRLNKRVIPRLTTAHNFKQGLPIYRFLCDLQAQDAHLNVSWNWGVLREQTYLPRVRYRRVIVSRATWQLPTHTLTPDNPLRLVAQLTAAGLPDQFVVAQADHELLISMHVPASLDLLIQEIRKTDRIKLIECLTTPDRCPLKRQRDAYTHELVIPFQNPDAPVFAGLPQAAEAGPQRRFSVGSEWFYLKIYTGEKMSDLLLTDSIYPVVQQLLKTQIISAFFFVRYQDTDPHLRLRFRGNPHVEFYQYVVRAVEQALREAVGSGVVHRVQVETYQRELERYGMAQIERCETLFHYDSLSTLALLAHTGGVFDEDLRFAVGVAKIDRLLTGLGWATAARRRLLSHLKEHFFAEFGGESTLRQQLNDKYRHYRPVLSQALSGDFNPADGLWRWEREQTAVLTELATGITDAEQLFSITGSLVHMILNRLFPSKQRLYELVVYHCLARQYDTLAAREASVVDS